MRIELTPFFFIDHIEASPDPSRNRVRVYFEFSGNTGFYATHEKEDFESLHDRYNSITSEPHVGHLHDSFQSALEDNWEDYRTKVKEYLTNLHQSAALKELEALEAEEEKLVEALEKDLKEDVAVASTEQPPKPFRWFPQDLERIKNLKQTVSLVIKGQQLICDVVEKDWEAEHLLIDLGEVIEVEDMNLELHWADFDHNTLSLGLIAYDGPLREQLGVMFDTDADPIAWEVNKTNLKAWPAWAQRIVLDREETLRLLAVDIATTLKTACAGDCGVGYCDENGCLERKRELVEPNRLQVKAEPTNQPKKHVINNFTDLANVVTAENLAELTKDIADLLQGIVEHKAKNKGPLEFRYFHYYEGGTPTERTVKALPTNEPGVDFVRITNHKAE